MLCEKATDVTALRWPRNWTRTTHASRAASQSRAVASAEAVARKAPAPWEKAQATTRSRWPLRTATRTPLVALKARAAASPLPVTRRAASGESATDVSATAWAVIVHWIVDRVAFQTRTTPRSSPVAT